MFGLIQYDTRIERVQTSRELAALTTNDIITAFAADRSWFIAVRSARASWLSI